MKLLFDRLIQWRYGVRRISEKHLESLKKIKHKGILLEAIPQADRIELNSLPNVFIPLLYMRYSKFSFEIWKFYKEIRFYFHASDRKTADAIKSQFNALYQKTVFRESNDFPKIKAGDYVSASTMNLGGMPFGLKQIQSFISDPLAQLLYTMRTTPSNFIFQIVFIPVKFKKKDREVNAFEALIRIVTIANNSFEARRANEIAASTFHIFDTKRSWLRPKFVSFSVPFLNDPLNVLKDVLKRSFFLLAKGILLSKEEIASLVHLPVRVDIPEIEYTRLRFDGGNGVLLGYARYSEEEIRDSLQDLKNIHIPGMPGTGKSVFLANLALQAFKQGYCCHVIDPHGDLALDLLQAIEPERIKDVVFLDPTKIDFCLNPLELDVKEGRELAIETTIGEITEMMKRLFGRAYWGPSMNRTFQNALRALYSIGNPTFEDLIKVLLKREDFASAEVKQFQKEIDFLSRERIDAVINKIDPFVKNKMLYNLFCRRKSSIDFKELTQEGKLVIWRLPKASLTQPMLELIGTGIITKLWFWVASRQKRNPILLMIDEFQIFSSLETLGIMLSEGRKYGLQLALAHQNLQQLKERRVSVEDVFGNTQTKVIFRLSGYDALLMARSLDITRQRDLVYSITNLPDGVALVKLTSGFGRRLTLPFEIKTPKPPVKRFHEVDSLIERMKERYAVKIEAEGKKRGISPEILDLLKAIHELTERGEEPTKTKLSEFLGKSGSVINDLMDKAETFGYLERRITQHKGKSKVVSILTEKGKHELGLGISMGTSAKAGEELHRTLILKTAKWLRGQGYYVKTPEQAGREKQPDLIAWERKGEGWGNPIAFEIETKGQHPEQVRQNLLKNVKKGMWVIFIAPDEMVKRRVVSALGDQVKYCRVYLESEMMAR